MENSEESPTSTSVTCSSWSLLLHVVPKGTSFLYSSFLFQLKDHLLYTSWHASNFSEEEHKLCSTLLKGIGTHDVCLLGSLLQKGWTIYMLLQTLQFFWNVSLRTYGQILQTSGRRDIFYSKPTWYHYLAVRHLGCCVYNLCWKRYSHDLQSVISRRKNSSCAVHTASGRYFVNARSLINNCRP